MNPSVTSDYANYLKLTGNEAAAASLTLAAALRECELPTPEPTEGMLSIKQAAAYLGYTTGRLRELVEATRQSHRGQDVTEPTIQHFQTGKKGAILFRREWLDEFIERYRISAGTLVPVPPHRRHRSKATSRRAVDAQLARGKADWAQARAQARGQ